mmetsp:Transcript_47056/g.106094  ORF Transcript_47056/g.106094 Transcript_47056/m.106094 type:complete len:202 (+) Transcript_47056:389-994(+)
MRPSGTASRPRSSVLPHDGPSCCLQNAPASPRAAASRWCSHSPTDSPVRVWKLGFGWIGFGVAWGWIGFREAWSNSTHAWPMLPFSLILGSITAMYPPPSGSLPNRSGSSTNLLLISITDPRTQAYTLKELSSSIVTVQIMSLGDMKIAPPFFLPDTSASIRFFESCVRNATFFTTRGGCIIGCDFEIPRMQSPLECTWRC